MVNLTWGYTDDKKKWVDIHPFIHPLYCENYDINHVKSHIKKLAFYFDYFYYLQTHEVIHIDFFKRKRYIEFCSIISELGLDDRFFVVDNEMNKNSKKFEIIKNYISGFIARDIHKHSANHITKHFVCHNNQQKLHRDYVVNFIKNNNIEDKVFLSYHKGIPGGPKNGSEVTSEYLSSFCNIVTETLFEHNIDEWCGFSEKIMKPIVAGIPFVLVGQYKSLERLKEVGFKTFSEWWDESYDLEEDESNRLDKIGKVIFEISQWPLDKCKDIYLQMGDVVEYNSNLYKELEKKYSYLFSFNKYELH